MFDPSFVPTLPFPGFKWRWATFAPTESINDPIILLGVLDSMYKLKDRGLKFSSPEFTAELESLSERISGSGVSLGDRTGERNLMRNSQQYWKTVGLIPKVPHKRGQIELTTFGTLVAQQKISQTEFAAATIMSLQLPNRLADEDATCDLWDKHGISIYPLKLILSIAKGLCGSSSELLFDGNTNGGAYLTADELSKIVIPLSATPNRPVSDYVEYIRAYRQGLLNISNWPNCQERSNDERMANEFLLFLSNYGYLIREKVSSRGSAKNYYNYALDDEIEALTNNQYSFSAANIKTLDELKRIKEVASEVDRKRFSISQDRPEQSSFRKALLAQSQQCVVTAVQMPEVLQAAHIRPVKYNGGFEAANGFLMRSDIHLLYDSNDIRISPRGEVVVSDKVRMNYGASAIREYIRIPEYVNLDYVQWRWENYHGM